MTIDRLYQSDVARSLAVILPLSAAALLWQAGALGRDAARVLEDVSNRGLNEIAENEQTRNYYEQAMNAERGQWGRGGLVRMVSRWLRKGEAGAAKGNWIRLQDTAAVREIDGYLDYELVPGADVIHMDVPVKVNSFGQRDHEYELGKPPGTFRIALVGGSNTMGYGVELDGTFAKLIEARLNRELAGTPGGYERYEVINFSVGGYQLLDRLYVVEQKMPPFSPDLIMISVTMHDLRWAVHQRLAGQIAAGEDVHFDFVRQIMTQARAEPGQSEIKARQRLSRYRRALVLGTFEELERFSGELGAPVAAVMLRLRVNELHPTMLQQADLAEEAGLLVLRVFDAYEGRSGDEMYLRPRDQHPSALAHTLIADELYANMIDDPTIHALLLGNREENEAP